MRLVAVRQDGFTYVMILVAVVLVGIAAEAATLMTSRLAQAERERELLFRGQAYIAAIRSYYEAGTGTKSFPRAISDLVKDPRFPSKHHIRQLYADPMTTLTEKGSGQEWLLVRAADGGIQGVASRSTNEPLKKVHFPKTLTMFEDAKSYREWIFQYVPANGTDGKLEKE